MNKPGETNPQVLFFILYIGIQLILLQNFQAANGYQIIRTFISKRNV